MNYNNVAFEAAVGTAEGLPPVSVPEVCFSGRSTVGKSSLINRLLNRKSFARVSSQPGKTVTVNFYKLPELRLVDLPGYGFARVSFSEKQRWSGLMESYFNSGRRISCVFQLIDSRHAATADDIDMLSFLAAAGYPTVIVFTKCDKLNKTERSRREEEFGKQLEFTGNTKKTWFSAVTGEGAEELKKIIESAAAEA